MNSPEFHHTLARFGCGAALLALTPMVWAESPEKASKKGARSQPQVIYHLPSSSNSAATLHSQDKGQTNDIPAEGMPTPAQRSRENASGAGTPPPQETSVKPPKVQSDRSRSQPHSRKPKEQGNSRGPKSHKK
jgi:hypothetical protein